MSLETSFRLSVNIDYKNIVKSDLSQGPRVFLRDHLVTTGIYTSPINVHLQ